MSLSSKLVFYHALKASVRAGLAPGQAVELADEGCRQDPLFLGPRMLRLLEIVGETRAPALGVSGATLEDIAGRLRGGAPFSEALGLHPDEFPAWETAIVKVGEKTGNLDKAFGLIEDILERQRSVLLAAAAKAAGPMATLTLTPWIVLAPIGFLAGPLVYLASAGVLCFFLTPLSRLFFLGSRAPLKERDSRGFAKMQFTQCLAWLVKAGVSVDESIALAAGDQRLAKSGPLPSGQTAHEQLRRCGFFSHQELTSLQIGETCGKLDATLEALAREARRQYLGQA